LGNQDSATGSENATMKRGPFLAGLAAFVLTILICAPAQAFFHLWRFTEFFSNADGSVQFIELESSGPAENQATGAVFSSLSTGKTVTLTENLSGSTLNERLLLATPGFAALPGAVSPDFEIPVNFFNPADDTVSLFHHQPIDSRTFSSIPTDGVFSRVYPQGNNQLNSPTNFAGLLGHVNLTIFPGDYNDNGTVDMADYVVWQDNVNTTNVIPNDTTPEWVMQEDYDVWRKYFGNTKAGPAIGMSLSNAVPEPSPAAWLLAGLLAKLFQCVPRLRRRRLPLGDRCRACPA
jgi:hypothetical protein